MQLTEAQVHSFRARRGHLSGAGAATPAAVARAVVGIQAQVETWAWWSIALRMDGGIRALELEREVLETRSLVRTWAQRDTLHLYASDDWPLITAADPLWPMSGRRGAQPPDHALDATRLRLERGVLTRADLLDLVTPEMFEEMAARTGPEQAGRYAAGRLVWRLAHLGEVCFGPAVGAEQGYVARRHWLPDLDFPVLRPEAAATALTRRYLAVNGPATAQDIAHYFGANIGKVKSWLADLRAELFDIECGGRKGLIALAADADDLRAGGDPPPPRLLAAYDSLLMAFADKTWTVPDPAENKAIWRQSAIVGAVVLAGGRAVATWSQKKTKKAVQITLEPLSGWRPDYLAALEKDAAALAAHLDLPTATLEVG